LYLGCFNSIEIEEAKSITLFDFYGFLLKGIQIQFFKNIGFLILAFIILFNVLFIRFKIKSLEGKWILNCLKWCLIFTVIYILLIPLGGYRSWRPYVLRYDTLIPVNTILIFSFALTTLFIFKNRVQLSSFKIYSTLICFILILFKIADKPHFDQNKCERLALYEVSKLNITLEELNCNCKVLSWDIKPNNTTNAMNQKLLKYYGIVQ